MATWASLNGQRVVAATVTMPYYGRWVADVELSAAVTVSGVATLVMGNLTLVGAVVQQDSYGGQQSVRLEAGGGGWQKQCAPRAYSLPSGVLLSMVLADLAQEVGEKVNVLADGPVGAAYVRESAAAQRVLEQLAGVAWWVDKAGVTQVGPRPAAPVPSPLQVLSYDPPSGKVSVATESPADWLPGATFAAPQLSQRLTASLVTHKVTGSGATVDVLAMPTAAGLSTVDRLNASIRAVIRGELPRLTFLGTYEYAVQAVASDGSTFDASPTNTAVGVPGLIRIPVRNGVAGTRCRPAQGSLIAVGFLNDDPTRPFVHGGYDGSDAQAIVVQSGTVGAARGGYTSVPPGLSAPFPPASLVVPTGDQVVLAFTALDSGGSPASGASPGITPPPPLWDGMLSTQKSYYPATAAGFAQALAASASLTPPGTGVGVVTGYVSQGSGTVTIG